MRLKEIRRQILDPALMEGNSVLNFSEPIPREWFNA
jgi:hypothetical protein